MVTHSDVDCHQCKRTIRIEYVQRPSSQPQEPTDVDCPRCHAKDIWTAPGNVLSKRALSN